MDAINCEQVTEPGVIAFISHALPKCELSFGTRFAMFPSQNFELGCMRVKPLGPSDGMRTLSIGTWPFEKGANWRDAPLRSVEVVHLTASPKDHEGSDKSNISLFLRKILKLIINLLAHYF
jgi:hypothetical protein